MFIVTVLLIVIAWFLWNISTHMPDILSRITDIQRDLALLNHKLEEQQQALIEKDNEKD